jgi:predicted RNA-binding Zn-ribbon protein involved in translation (DUF1610 family)
MYSVKRFFLVGLATIIFSSIVSADTNKYVNATPVKEVCYTNLSFQQELDTTGILRMFTCPICGSYNIEKIIMDNTFTLYYYCFDCYYSCPVYPFIGFLSPASPSFSENKLLCVNDKMSVTLKK